MDEELKNILEKVRCLYLKYGIKSITMDDVSRELGISKKTLYQYVTDKTDLINKVLELEMTISDCKIQKLSDSNLNAIEEMIEMHRHVYKSLKEFNPAREYDLRKYYPELYQNYNEKRRNKVLDWVIRNIGKGKEDGTYRPNINPNLIAKILMMRYEFFAGSDNELSSINDTDAARDFIEVLEYHVRGIATAKGIHAFEKAINQMASNSG